MSDLDSKRGSFAEVKAEAERLTLQRLGPTLASKKARKERIDAIPEAEIVEEAPKKK